MAEAQVAVPPIVVKTEPGRVEIGAKRQRIERGPPIAIEEEVPPLSPSALGQLSRSLSESMALVLPAQLRAAAGVGAAPAPQPEIKREEKKVPFGPGWFTNVQRLCNPQDPKAVYGMRTLRNLASQAMDAGYLPGIATTQQLDVITRPDLCQQLATAFPDQRIPVAAAGPVLPFIDQGSLDFLPRWVQDPITAGMVMLRPFGLSTGTTEDIGTAETEVIAGLDTVTGKRVTLPPYFESPLQSALADLLLDRTGYGIEALLAQKEVDERKAIVDNSIEVSAAALTQLALRESAFLAYMNRLFRAAAIINSAQPGYLQLNLNPPEFLAALGPDEPGRVRHWLSNFLTPAPTSIAFDLRTSITTAGSDPENIPIRVTFLYPQIGVVGQPRQRDELNTEVRRAWSMLNIIIRTRPQAVVQAWAHPILPMSPA